MGITSYVKIQCALFKETDRVDFIDRKEFRGAIQERIEEAQQFVLRHTNKGTVIDGFYGRIFTSFQQVPFVKSLQMQFCIAVM